MIREEAQFSIEQGNEGCDFFANDCEWNNQLNIFIFCALVIALHFQEN